MQKLSDSLNNMRFVVSPDSAADAEAPILYCETCEGKGYVNIPGRHTEDGTWISNQLIVCPNPNCPIVAQQQRDRYSKLCQKASVPLEYQSLTFAAWETLKRYPEFMAGKWDAYGSALAFVEARENRFMFTLDQAAQAVHLEVDPERSMEGEKNSLVFSGINGIGKTSLAVSIAQELLGLQIPVLYARTADVLAAVKERFDQTQKAKDYEFDWGDSEQSIIGTFQQFPVLILDEFGVSQYTAWRCDIVEQIVRYRYSNQKPTIFTTNLGYDELASDDKWRRATGHAVHGMAHWLQMGGRELRRRNGAVQSR